MFVADLDRCYARWLFVVDTQTRPFIDIISVEMLMIRVDVVHLVCGQLLALVGGSSH